MKKLIGIIIMMNLAVFGFTQGGNEEKQEDKSNLTPAGTFPIVNEEITLELLIPSNPNVSSYDDNDLTLYIEDLTNLNLNFIEIPSNDFEAKINLTMSSGSNLPDIIMNRAWRVSSSLVGSWGAQGLIIPLNDLIEEYGNNTKKIFNEFPFVKTSTTMDDGNIYSLFELETPGCMYCNPSIRIWMNKKWLVNLDLETPKTLDDFKAALIAFRDNDPNGNGINDEIPLTAGLNGWNSSIDLFLSGSFLPTFTGENTGFYLENGKIQAGFIKDEYRLLLEYMNDLSEENLLDDAAFTQDFMDMKQILMGEM